MPPLLRNDVSRRGVISVRESPGGGRSTPRVFPLGRLQVEPDPRGEAIPHTPIRAACGPTPERAPDPTGQSPTDSRSRSPVLWVLHRPLDHTSDPRHDGGGMDCPLRRERDVAAAEALRALLTATLTAGEGEEPSRGENLAATLLAAL